MGCKKNPGRSRGSDCTWQRSFDGADPLVSRFEPQGTFPDGDWIERSGPVAMTLGVDVAGGGWTWQQRALRVHGWPVPHWMAPRLVAGKRCEGDDYVFAVALSLPGFGEVLRYDGRLRLAA